MLRALINRYYYMLKARLTRKRYFAFYLGDSLLTGEPQFLCSDAEVDTHELKYRWLCKKLKPGWDRCVFNSSGYKFLYADLDSYNYFMESDIQDYKEYKQWWRDLMQRDYYKLEDLRNNVWNSWRGEERIDAWN